MTRALVLWSERTLPERDSRAAHPGSSRANENVDALCHEQVEAHDPHLFMALRHVTEFRQPLQVQSHQEMPRILVQLGHTQRT